MMPRPSPRRRHDRCARRRRRRTYRPFGVLESTKLLIDGIREETVPLLTEVRGSVERTNRELDRVDGMLISAGEIVQRLSRLSGLVERAATGPLVRIISVGAGVRRAVSRFGGKKPKPSP